jgi:hypothetical protein
LVPAEAIAMVDLRWTEVRSDGLLKQFAVLPRPADVLRSLGVSIDSAESVVAFSTSLESSGGGDTLIVSSPSVVRQFVTSVQQRNWPTRPIGSLSAYDDRSSGYVGLIVSDEVFAIGPQQPIERVAAVTQASAAAFLARIEFTDLGDMFKGAEPVHMAVAWPSQVRDASNALVAGSAGLLKLGGLGVLGSVVEKFGIGRAMGMSCSRGTVGLRCNIAGVMQDENTASFVSGGLVILKGLSSLVPEPQRHEGAGVSMSDLTVDRRGTTVTVGLSLR